MKNALREAIESVVQDVFLDTETRDEYRELVDRLESAISAKMLAHEIASIKREAVSEIIDAAQAAEEYDECQMEWICDNYITFFESCRLDGVTFRSRIEAGRSLGVSD